MREVAPAGTRLKRGGGGTKPRSGDQVYDRLYAGPTGAPISTWKQVPGTKPCWEAFFRNLCHAKTMWRFVPERADICDLCKVLTDRMYWKTPTEGGIAKKMWACTSKDYFEQVEHYLPYVKSTADLKVFEMAVEEGWRTLLERCWKANIEFQCQYEEDSDELAEAISRFRFSHKHYDRDRSWTNDALIWKSVDMVELEKCWHGKRNWSWSWEIINPELATLLQNKIESATQKEVKLSPDELSDFDGMDTLMGPPKYDPWTVSMEEVWDERMRRDQARDHVHCFYIAVDGKYFQPVMMKYCYLYDTHERNGRLQQLIAEHKANLAQVITTEQIEAIVNLAIKCRAGEEQAGGQCQRRKNTKVDEKDILKPMRRVRKAPLPSRGHRKSVSSH